MALPRAALGLLLAALAVPIACSEELPPPEPDRPTIEPAVFGRALSDLVVARIQLLPDTAGYERRAREILAGHGVTADDLRAFVRARGQDDDLMTGIYSRVSARLDSLYPVERPGAADVQAGIDSLIGAAGRASP